MSNFDSALTNQMARLATARRALPTENKAAYESLARTDKVLDFLQPYLGHAGDVQGFTQHTPGFFQHVYATLVAREFKESAAKTRGDGRLASAIDNIRSNGNGLNKAARSVEQFLGLEPSKLNYTAENHFKLTLPEVDVLPKSGDVFRVMEARLQERAREAKAGGLTKEKKKELLLTPGWTESKIIEYTIEYLSRAFVFKMEDDVRHDLVRTTLPFSFALDTLELAALPAAV
jgi:hypothetical protein